MISSDNDTVYFQGWWMQQKLNGWDLGIKKFPLRVLSQEDQIVWCSQTTWGELQEKVSQYSASHILRKAFPNAESMIAGKSHTKHIFGITPVEDVTLESSAGNTIQAGEASSCSQHNIPAPVAVLLETEQVRNKQLMERIQLLEARVQQLEKTSPVTPSCSKQPNCSMTA